MRRLHGMPTAAGGAAGLSGGSSGPHSPCAVLLRGAAAAVDRPETLIPLRHRTRRVRATGGPQWWGGALRSTMPEATPLTEDELVAEGAALALLPAAAASDLGVLPLAIEGDRLRVAIGDLRDFDALDAVRAATGRSLRPRLADPAELAEAIDRAYGSHAERMIAGMGGGAAGAAGDTEGIEFRRLGGEARGAGAGAHGRQPRQPPDPRRGAGRRVRRAHRALREGAPGEVSHRRPAAPGGPAAAAPPRRGHVADQGDRRAGHRRAVPAAGRPHRLRHREEKG